MTIKKMDLEELLQKLGEVHPDLRPISSEDVVVANWVRLKCRYGCNAYGRLLGCPPYSPTPDETRNVLEVYRVGVIARFEADPDDRVSPEHLHHHLRDSIKRASALGERPNPPPLSAPPSD